MTNIDPVAFSYGPDSRMGGVDITISLTRTQADALGGEAGTMADWLHTALWALAMLRTGQDSQGRPYIPGPNDWHTAINDVDRRLLPRLEGLRDALVRAHADGGGSVGDLALAMDVARSTAQYRRDAIRRQEPGLWEQWATSGGPTTLGGSH
jgi:hypothetical protein